MLEVGENFVVLNMVQNVLSNNVFKKFTVTSFLSETHFWSLKNQYSIAEGDIGCFSYHEKGDSSDRLYGEEKLNYVESRDSTWTLTNKRPEKLRDNIKELEDLLSLHKCVKCRWITRKVLQLYLSNGILVTLIVSQHTGDLDLIFIDKSLVGKVGTDSPSDVLLIDGWIILCYADKCRLDVICLMKKYMISSDSKKIEKLSAFDPKITQCEIPGPIGRRLKRRLIANANQDMIMVWWSTASSEVCPWSPMVGEDDRANLILLSINGQQLEIVAYCSTEYEPVGIQFSIAAYPQQIMSIEQALSSTDKKPLELCVYDTTTDKLQRSVLAATTLTSEAVCYNHTLQEDKVMIGCADARLLCYDYKTKKMAKTNAAFVPSYIQWHSSGIVAMIASKKAQFQIVDTALSTVLFQSVSENYTPMKTLELSQYLRSAHTLEHIEWNPVFDETEIIAECTDSMCFVFDRGPIGVVRLHFGVISQGLLTPLLLLTEYLKHAQIDQSVKLLESMNWNVDGSSCFTCLEAIVNYLFKRPLNADRELCLVEAFGTFYNPSRPLSEATMLEYRDPVSRLARRFFHHLLRFTRFEKAFLLAVDIGSRDLFMDIHFVARDHGEMALSEVARRKAEELYDEVHSTDTSDDDYSQSSDGSYDHVPPVPPRSAVHRHPHLHDRPLPAIPNEEVNIDDVPFHLVHNSVTQSTLSRTQNELTDRIMNEYTASLLDEIPPPLQDGDSGDASSSTQSKKKVQVIHFGVV